MPTLPEPATALSIADVERDTGLGKDTLRVWERRYGFPRPGRDAQGQRVYTQQEVDRLRQIAALLRAGHRPGRVVPLDEAARQALLQPEGAALAPSGEATGSGAQADAIAAALALLAERDALGLRRLLLQALTRQGLAGFVCDIVGPLTTAVGLGWMRGELRVSDEHLYTEVAHTVLRQGLAALPEPAQATAPRVLLTTLPGEPHGLGLLMAEAMCAMEGAWCVNLGPQTPIDEIVAAAAWHQAQVVGLSATGCLPQRWLRQGAAQLARRLPPGTALWLGGSAAAGLRGLAGATRMDDLRGIGLALSALPPRPSPAAA
ncbi:MAG: MerR family transcriptional regulator [Burkholderiaceae bacterium]